MSSEHGQFAEMSQSEIEIQPQWSSAPKPRPRRDYSLQVFVIAIAFTVAFFAFLYGLQEIARVSVPITEKFMDRGWTPYAAVFLTFWSIAILAGKLFGLRRQRFALSTDFLSPTASFETNQDLLQQIKYINEASQGLNETDIGPRMHRAIDHFISSRNVKEVGDILRDEHEAALGAMEDSYSLVRAFLWSIPILGFIGTVMGVSAAVGGFAHFLASVDNIDQIKNALGGVTSGLSVAFDTTFIALLLSLIVMWLMSVVERLEVSQLRQIDEYCHGSILRRLPSAKPKNQVELDILSSSVKLLVEELRSGIKVDGAGDQSGQNEAQQSLSEALDRQSAVLDRFGEVIQTSRREVNELIEARNKLECEIMQGPAASGFVQTLNSVQDALSQLNPILQRLSEKPLEVDVHLVAGHMKSSTRDDRS